MFSKNGTVLYRGWRSWRKKTLCWRVRRRRWTKRSFSTQRHLEVRPEVILDTKSGYISIFRIHTGCLCVCVCFRRWWQCVSDRGVSSEGVGSGEAAIPEPAQRVFQTGAEIRQPEGGDVPDQGDLLSTRQPWRYHPGIAFPFHFSPGLDRFCPSILTWWTLTLFDIILAAEGRSNQSTLNVFVPS